MCRRLVILLVVLASVLLAGTWLLTTESGLRWAWRQAQALTDLHADSVRGTLAGTLQVRGLQFIAGDTRVAIGSATLDWQPRALLTGTLAFRRLQAHAVRIRLPDTAPDEGAPFIGFSLPLAVALPDARVDDLQLFEGDRASFSVTRAELSARLKASQLTVERLSLDGPWGSVRIRGRVGTRPTAPLKLATEWRLALPQFAAPLSGRGRIGGTLGRPRTLQRITSPFSARLSAQVDWQRAALPWQLRVTTAGVPLQQLQADWPEVTLAGEAVFDGRGSTFTARAETALNAPEVGTWDLLANVHADDTWTLDRLLLRQRDGTARLQARGHWGWALDTPGLVENARLELDWHDLPWPLQATEPAVTLRDGTLVFTGNLADYRLDGAVRAKPPDLPPASLRWTGRGDRQAFNARHLAVNWIDGEATGTGRLGWERGVDWRLDLDGGGFDPNRLDSRLTGAVSFSAAAQGRLPADGAATASVTLQSLAGNLRGEPLSGGGTLRLAGERLTVDGLRLAVGQAVFTGDGTVGNRWEMAWQLTAPRLARLHPELAGQLRVEGRLDGPREAPRIRIEGSAESIAVDRLRAESLVIDADIDLAGQTPWKANVTATGLDGPQVPPVERVTLAADGRADEHRVRLEAIGSGLRLVQIANGGYASGHWSGRLHDGRLEGLPPDAWRQTAPAALAVSREGIRLERFCWVSRDAQACTRIAGDVGQLSLDAFPLAALDPFLAADNVQLSGRIDADVKADLTTGSFDARMDAAGAGFRYGEGETDITVRVPTARIAAGSGAEGTRLFADLVLEPGGRLEARLNSPRPFPFGGDAPLQGSLSLDATEFAWIALLLPELADPQGRIAGRFDVAGRVGDPDLRGRLVLEQASVFVVSAGIRIQPLRLELQATGGDRLAIAGEAQSGPGRLVLRGSLETKPPWKLSATLAGHAFEALRLPQARVVVTPDLRLSVAPGQVTVSGRLHIPTADIDLGELPREVRRSPDVVVIREQGAVAADPGWQTRADVTVTFGEDVRLSGYGFSGRLTGQLAISEATGEVATATGELRVRDGRYEAYGQELAITQGRLLFAGTPVTDPAVDFRAVREVADVTVGVVATGQLQRPEVRLFSEPPMDDSDALSYLIIGRPLDQASRSEGSLLYGAALKLGLRGGNFLAEQIGNRFGIEEVELQTDPDTEAASLVLGTHLSPRLYLQYVVGFAEAVNRVRIRYQLGENWTLEAVTGDRAGTDLLYSIER